MKATRLVVIAAIVTVAMLSQTAEATSKPKPGERPIHLTFEEAMTDPGLVQVMYQQLNHKFLIEILDGIDGDYTARIVYLGIRIYVTGTYIQWHQFFLLRKLVQDTNEKNLN
jgi:hypothetical protein